MCGVEVTFDADAENDEQRIKVHPDKNDPFSRGSMCPKAAALGPLHYDPSKLRQPVKKVGDDWQPISWQEAYRTVSEKIIAIRDKYGADAIASYLGNPIVHNLGMMLFVKTLTRAIGSKNVFSATSMDQLPHHFIAHFMYGHEFRIPVPDIDRTDFMIIMGANPLASNGSIMTSAGVTKRLHEIENRGGKFIVIDPRKTETAKIASAHHFIKPGTDLYFLLAFLHIVFRDNRVRLGRISRHVKDFEKLEPLVSEFTPETVAPITGIDAGTIERTVAEFCNLDRSVLYGRMGLSTQPHGGLCHWLINIINLATGNFDCAGGMMFPTPAIELARDKVQHDVFGRWSSRVRGLKEFAGELPVSAMTEEFTTEGEGQVKAFMTICGNPVLSSPGGHRLDKALENVEFMFSIDNYINETTRHADLILPTPSGLEIDHYDFIFNTISVSNNAKFSEAYVDVGEDRPFDWQVLKELTRRISPNGLSLVDKLTTPRRLVNWGLMLGAYGKLSSPKRWLNGLTLEKVIASKHGINLGPLKSRVPEGMITADRKIHAAPDIFIQRLAEVKADEFPELLKSAQQSSSKQGFSYIGRRNVSTNNSWMHQVKKLSRSKQVRCTAMINPIDATSLNIFDGEDIKVRSRAGEIVLPAEVTASMMPGVVCIPHGFGHNKSGTRVPFAEAKPGVSVNDITDHLRLDKLTGNAAFSGLPIEIEKISSRVQAVQLSGKPLSIIYGSQSGNAEMIALDLAKTASEYDLLGKVENMNEVDLQKLSQSERILVITSTFGEGDMPDNAEDLWQAISADDAPRFDNSYFSVLALGDRSYETFCQAGNLWRQRLLELGAMQVSDLVECDVDYVDKADQWVETVLPLITEKGDQTIVSETTDNHSAAKKVRYNKQNPMFAELTEKRLLNREGSSKQTMHYELSLQDYDVDYEVGDAFYLIPRNDQALVDQILKCLGFAADDQSLRERLSDDLEIRLVSQDTLNFLARLDADSPLNQLKDDAKALEKYLWGRDLLNLLQSHTDAVNHRDDLIATLKPIQPRAYSISSSVKKYPAQVHLTVATLRYEFDEREYSGVSSTYLADTLEVGERVACYLVPNKYFTVPADDAVPMIMVGPGTGVAPFRGFLLERQARQASGENWLFFGDRSAESDFLYRDEFEAMQQSGLLNRLDLAFSRDQKDKIYVQDRMLEQASELFDWLEKGAYFFVCGDANRMARDVEATLHDIIQKQGDLNSQQAIDYVEKLKKEKRYIRDVY